MTDKSKNYKIELKRVKQKEQQNLVKKLKVKIKTQKFTCSY